MWNWYDDKWKPFVPYVVNSNCARQVEFTESKSSHKAIEITEWPSRRWESVHCRSAAFWRPVTGLIRWAWTTSKLAVCIDSFMWNVKMLMLYTRLASSVGVCIAIPGRYTRRRNHMCKVSRWNFQGLQFYMASNFPFSYWFCMDLTTAALLRCMW